MTDSFPSLPKPSSARQLEKHGIRVEDPYAWLRDAGYPKVDDKPVLDYLNAENAYFEAWKKPHEGLVETLFQELKGRQKEDDSSVPVKDGDYLYWWAFQARRAISPMVSQARRRRPRPADLRRGQEAEGRDYFRSARWRSAPTAASLPCWRTTMAPRRFKLRIRDLATGKDLETVTEVGIGFPGVERRRQGGAVHRGQRQLAQLPRPLSPARRTIRRTLAPCTRKPRTRASRSACRRARMKT
jgi:oligopeptidase B